MNQSEQTFSSLSEDERLNYLRLMEVPVWVRRANSESFPGVLPKLADKVVSKCDTELVAPLESNPAVKPASTIDTPAADGEELSLAETLPVEKPESIASTDARLSEASQFLKLVNWNSNSQADLNTRSAAVSNKKLLIVCRHQKDQPAQSFASVNSPSQFMRDYLSAVEQLTPADSVILETSLAHLTEAGLSQACRTLAESLTELQPNLILLLGDESVRHLLGNDRSVADSRGKCHSFRGYQLVVSYHPFTLIENPQLKKLALEDVRLLISLATGQFA